MRQEKEIIWLDTIFKLSRCRHGNPHRLWGLCAMCQLQRTHIMRWADVLIQSNVQKVSSLFPSRPLTLQTWLFMNVRWPWLGSNLWPFRYRIVSVTLPCCPVFEATSVFIKLFYNWYSFPHYNLVSRSKCMVKRASLIFFSNLIYCCFLYLTLNWQLKIQLHVFCKIQAFYNV